MCWSIIMLLYKLLTTKGTANTTQLHPPCNTTQLHPPCNTTQLHQLHPPCNTTQLHPPCNTTSMVQCMLQQLYVHFTATTVLQQVHLQQQLHSCHDSQILSRQQQTVRKCRKRNYSNCSWEPEIPHELVHDTSRTSSCFSDFREVSWTNSIHFVWDSGLPITTTSANVTFQTYSILEPLPPPSPSCMNGTWFCWVFWSPGLHISPAFTL